MTYEVEFPCLSFFGSNFPEGESFPDTLFWIFGFSQQDV